MCLEYTNQGPYTDFIPEVGFLDPKHPSIIVSIGTNKISNIKYAMWMPVDQGRIWEIGTVLTEGKERPEYRLKYRCDNIECMTRTFLTLVNSNVRFPYHFTG